MRDAYFHIPVHPQSRRYLRFTFNGQVYQFRAMCFGLSTAPQVFTRVVAPISGIMHLAGFRILLYLDDWLILAKSREEMERAITFILKLVEELGILVNLSKSVLVPRQSITYLGMDIDSLSFWVSPNQKRWARAWSMFKECSALELMPLRSWQRMLGHMADLERFVPGARLRMRPFQFFIRRALCGGSHQLDVMIPFPSELRAGLAWWLEEGKLGKGVSLEQVSPDVQMFSDASRKSWGATLGHLQVTGSWSEAESREHINVLELRAIFYALKRLEQSVKGKKVAIFSDNTTALSYIRKQGGTKSWKLFRLVEELILWAEDKEVILIPKFIEGKKNVLADTLSRKGQIVTSEWTLNQQVCQSLWRIWGCPQVDAFATSLTTRLPNYFSPHLDPCAIGVDALLQPWDHLDIYAFPPYAVIRRVINKLKGSVNCRMTLVAPWWPQREWFPDLVELLIDSPRALPLRRDLLRQPLARALHAGLGTLHLTAWRLSSNWPERRAYQAKWPRDFAERGPIPLMCSTN